MARETDAFWLNIMAVRQKEENGEIYKMELDGKILGKFGTAGKLLKEFGSVHEISSCVLVITTLPRSWGATPNLGCGGGRSRNR